jgi:hypothetical protein
MEGRGNTIKLIAAVLVILVACGWTFYRSRAAMPGVVANNGQMDEQEMPSPDEMRKTMKMAAMAADLSSTQTAKLEELADEAMKEAQKMMEQRDADTTRPQWGPPGEGGPRMGGGFPGMPMGGFGGPMGNMGRIIREGQQMMTQDQQDKFRQAMRTESPRAKREAKTRAALGETDYARYQEKRRERFGGFGGRGGGGGRGGRNAQGQGQTPGGNPPR